ncbi:hypothetical protein J4465_01065 [Candidatus Pacearchaeota archaeon]|nr:hypothetical protein [Candidatus Pacearchaeota archaeon]
MQKRGQVTIFIIIAILIIAIVALIFFVAIPNGWFGLKLQEDNLTPINNYFSQCFLDKSKYAVTIVASQAGYSDLQKYSLAVFYDEKTAYYSIDNKTGIPPINLIETELAKEIDKQIDYCFTFPTALKDYQIVKINCSSKVIVSDKIKITFDCPIQINKGAFSSKLPEKNTYNFNIDYNIVKKLNMSRNLINEYNSNKPYVCLNCINSIAENNNVFISMLPIIDNQTIKESWFLIKEQFYEQNISWRFAIKN